MSPAKHIPTFERLFHNAQTHHVHSGKKLVTQCTICFLFHYCTLILVRYYKFGCSCKFGCSSTRRDFKYKLFAKAQTLYAPLAYVPIQISLTPKDCDMKKIIFALISSAIFIASLRAQNEKQIRNQKLIEAKSSFEIVQSIEAKTPVTFQKIILFKHPLLILNNYYDAFVFKTSQGGYLYWSFQMDSTYLGGWYMLRYTANKDEKNSNYFSDFSFDDNALKKTSLSTIGQNSTSKLEPNSEYIIWFAAKTKNLPSDGIPTIISLNVIEDGAMSVKDFFAKFFKFDN